MAVMDEPAKPARPPEALIAAESPRLVFAATPLSAEQILEATARCLREEGYDATTIRRIAGRLDCAVGSIYRYYTDKRELLDAVAQSALEPAAALVEAGGSVEDSAALYHQIAASDPAMYRLMFWIAALDAATDGGQRTPGIVERIIRNWSRRLGDESAARIAWMTLHGCLMLGADEEPSLDALRSVLRPGVSEMRELRPVAARPAVQVDHVEIKPVIIGRKPVRRPREVQAASTPAILEPVEDVVLL